MLYACDGPLRQVTWVQGLYPDTGPARGSST